MRLDPRAFAASRRAPGIATATPPPVGGWDTRNALVDMPPQNAVILDNWFPSTDKVTLRKGHQQHVTGMSGNVDTLMPYIGTDGSEELFAANSGNIYDVTSAGSVGAAAVSGLSGNQWQHTQMNTAGGGNFLFMANGVDTARTYDGSSHATSTITGAATLSDVIWCNVHERRLWFGEKNSLTAYYLAVNSISGAATAFELGGLAGRGGKLVGMATWTRDSGAGPDDIAVFLTSEGQAILYAGTDPSDASAWGLLGVFDIGKPLGQRPFCKLGTDLILLTQDGVVPASKMFITDRVQAELVAVSQQINKAFNDAVRDGISLFGWQPIPYAKSQMLVINVPDSGSVFNQFVFNTITQAPCRFTGWNGRSWGILNDHLYFGDANGTVYKADQGKDDNSQNITGDMLPAFSYFGDRAHYKAFKMVEPVWQSDGDPYPALELQLDFEVTNAIGAASVTPTDSALWGVAKWGVGTWGTSNQVFRGWRGITGVGKAASLRMRVDTMTVQPSLVATNWLFMPGGALA